MTLSASPSSLLFMRHGATAFNAAGLRCGGDVDLPLTELGHLQSVQVAQHLAALRTWFNFLTVRQVMTHNPAQVVKGPRYSITTGKTAVLSAEEARALLDKIDTSTLAGLRDRALIGVMLMFCIAQIGPALVLFPAVAWMFWMGNTGTGSA